LKKRIDKSQNVIHTKMYMYKNKHTTKNMKRLSWWGNRNNLNTVVCGIL